MTARVIPDRPWLSVCSDPPHRMLSWSLNRHRPVNTDAGRVVHKAVGNGAKAWIQTVKQVNQT